MNRAWWADEDNLRIWLGTAVVAAVSCWISPWLLVIEATPPVMLMLWLGLVVKREPWNA
jgi:hypothetical protein